MQSIVGLLALFFFGFGAGYFLYARLAKPEWAVIHLANSGVDVNSSQMLGLIAGCLAFAIGGAYMIIDDRNKNTQPVVDPMLSIGTQSSSNKSSPVKDEQLERIALIGSIDDLGKPYDSVHPTQISSQEARGLAKSTVQFLKGSDDLVQQGAQAPKDTLSSTAQAAFMILGAWPSADAMAQYKPCEMAVRNLSRISAMRNAAQSASDPERAKQLIKIADSLIEPYHSSTKACEQKVN